MAGIVVVLIVLVVLIGHSIFIEIIPMIIFFLKKSSSMGMLFKSG